MELPGTSNSFENAHEVIKGDSRIDGPYLDDIREAEHEEYRKARTKALKEADKERKAAQKKLHDELIAKEQEKDESDVKSAEKSESEKEASESEKEKASK